MRNRSVTPATGSRLSCQQMLCAASAMSGQLEKLKLLRMNDTLWDADTSCAAAMDGHLEVLQWLRANGCPWDAVMCKRRQRAGFSSF